MKFLAFCESNYIQFFHLLICLLHAFFFPFSYLGKMQDKDGKIVYEKAEKPRIHTDGTGFISEDLALLCPNNLHRGHHIRDETIEVCDFGFVSLQYLFLLLIGYDLKQ